MKSPVSKFFLLVLAISAEFIYNNIDKFVEVAKVFLEDSLKLLQKKEIMSLFYTRFFCLASLKQIDFDKKKVANKMRFSSFALIILKWYLHY